MSQETETEHNVAFKFSERSWWGLSVGVPEGQTGRATSFFRRHDVIQEMDLGKLTGEKQSTGSVCNQHLHIGMGMFDHRAQKTIFRHSIFYFLAFLLVAWLLSNAAPAQVRNYSSNKYLFIDSTVDPDLVSRRIVLVYFSQFMMVIGSLTIHKLE